ncbi:hypothetical protein KC950_03230 [Candidatus Saccharibacteria bacterium]|nr:hypothetical protein [Candidatus Saccharibacteria bacterium]
MIGRASFTAPEWNTIQTAILGTIEYVSMSTTNTFGDIKEQVLAKREISKFADEFDSIFVKELSDFSNYKSPLPPHADNDFKSIETPLMQLISSSVESIQQRYPETAETFKKLIVHLAEEVSHTYKTASQPEKDAIDKIKHALESPPHKTYQWDVNNPLAKP